ncbi:MAG TPA: CoA transferase [Candidatus Acidoferrales bacterium]|nr:CoA transferase [Candidatus Acidoferrales bacterium]
MPEEEPRSWRAPLHLYRVLDLTDELGWLCGHILAELGATVVKVEPPGGDPGRRVPPLVEGASGETVSAVWLAYNSGKRGITLDLEADAGRRALLDLVAHSHFLIESFKPGYLKSIGLGWELLRQRNPSLVMTSITPYGQSGPQAAAPAGDLELMAASGAMWLAGDPDRPPVRITHPQAACWGSLHAAVGTLIAHHHRQQTGRGQHVDASVQAGLLPALVVAPCFWEMLGESPRRAGAYLTGRNLNGVAVRNIWPCRDGYVTYAIYGGLTGRQSNRQLAAWMAERGQAPEFLQQIDWDHFEVASATADQVARLELAIGAFLRTLTRGEFVEGALARRILGYSVATAAEIAQDPQLQARQAWQVLDDPTLGSQVRQPSGFVRFDGRAPRLARPAPRLGEHNREVLEQERLAEAGA